MSGEEMAQIAALRTSGATLREIARETGYHRSTIGLWAARLGMPRALPSPAAMASRHTLREGGHLLWTGIVLTCPVLQLRRGGVSINLSARRVLYEARYGPLPAGALLYRTCEVAECVVPAHASTDSRRRASSPRWMRELNAGARRVAS